MPQRDKRILGKTSTKVSGYSTENMVALVVGVLHRLISPQSPYLTPPTRYLLNNRIKLKFTLEENSMFNFYSRGLSTIALLRYFSCRGARSITSTSTSTVLFTTKQQDKAKGKR